ncbi:MAG TPA: PorT family protein, partial [Bacteroidaceae bacterium]|nr:PorT family protein [Bacteroidaceae bacterium]
ANLTHSRFFTSYLTVPLLLEFQIPAGGDRIHLSGGVIGGAKLWSNTRMKYRTPGSKSKNRIYGDYNLTPLRYGATVRAGYGNVSLYANYYLSSLFKKEKGPELYPFAVGLSFNW